MATAFESRELSATWIDTLRQRRLALLTGCVVLVSLGFARLVLTIDIAAVVVLFASIAVIAIVIQPRNGLYMLLVNALLFDGVNLDPLMKPGWYLNTSLQTTAKVAGGIVIPFEMILLFSIGIWLAQGIRRRRLDFRGGWLGRGVLLFTLALVFGVVRGTLANANVNYIFWESRFLFSMVLTYILAVNTIRTRAHVRTLLTLIFVCLSVSGVEAIWRKYALINQGLLDDGYRSGQEFWYGHDGVVIWGLLVMLVVAQQVFGGPRWQRYIGPFCALVMGFAMLLSERRAGLVAIMIALSIFTFTLLTSNRKAFLFIALPAILLGGSYLAVFWNNPGTLGQGARAVRSITSPDTRDANSNAWRDMEAVNVRATITSDPLLGVGFGRPFLQVIKVPDISGFEFWNYEAHHDVLWVWMKTGAFGFTVFFFLLLGAIARSVWLARTLPHPDLKVIAILALSAIIMSLVYCYVDLGLVVSRLPIVLGILLGTTSVLDRIRN